MNSIPADQNSAGLLRLLRARSRVYQVARWFQITQLLLTVGIPFACGLGGIFVIELRPLAAAYSVFAAILDMSWLDREQRSLLKKSARIAEQFDCELLMLPENKFATGKRLDPEEIHRLESAWSKGNQKLRDWYPVAVGAASLKFARIICQRANLKYDSELRKSYGRLLLGLATGIVLVLVSVGLVRNLPLLDFVTTTVVPGAPILIWALRERFRQRDTAIATDGVRSEAEAFWERATSLDLEDEPCTVRSREFQDAIFRHRSTSPLIFPFIYSAKRAQLEQEMNAGARQMLFQIGVS